MSVLKLLEPPLLVQAQPIQLQPRVKKLARFSLNRETWEKGSEEKANGRKKELE